jgi:hypothetical protein
MDSEGLLCVLFILSLLSVAIFGTIFKKAGYPFSFGLLMLIPIVSLICLIWFAATKWPIEEELAQLRGGRRGRGSGRRTADSGSPPPVSEKPAGEPSVEDLLNQAGDLDAEGEWEKALELFEQLAPRLQGQQDGEYARNCAREIRKKIAQEREG